MSNVFSAVVRLGMVVIGCVVLVVFGVDGVNGWGAVVGLSLMVLGAASIIASARASADAERREMELRRFEHVHFEDEDAQR